MVVIENQFGKTKHDQLGKLLTYGATLNASCVVRSLNALPTNNASTNARVTKDRSMSKKPSVKSEYHAKKDRLEITIKRSGLKKKSERKDLVKHLAAGLAKKTKGGKRPKNPWKESKIPEVGD